MDEHKKGGANAKGFAAMTPEKQRELAARGGKAAHAKRTAHEWTSETAKLAGRKGGMARRNQTAKVKIEDPT